LCSLRVAMEPSASPYREVAWATIRPFHKRTAAAVLSPAARAALPKKKGRAKCDVVAFGEWLPGKLDKAWLHTVVTEATVAAVLGEDAVAKHVGVGELVDPQPACSRRRRGCRARTRTTAALRDRGWFAAL